MIGIGDYTGSGFCLMDETETKLPEHASDLRMQETGAALFRDQRVTQRGSRTVRGQFEDRGRMRHGRSWH